MTLCIVKNVALISALLGITHPLNTYRMAKKTPLKQVDNLEGKLDKTIDTFQAEVRGEGKDQDKLLHNLHEVNAEHGTATASGVADAEADIERNLRRAKNTSRAKAKHLRQDAPEVNSEGGVTTTVVAITTVESNVTSAPGSTKGTTKRKPHERCASDDPKYPCCKDCCKRSYMGCH